MEAVMTMPATPTKSTSPSAAWTVPAAWLPDHHTQTSHRLDWNVIADGKPQYPRSRSEGRAD
jgi:hypothetical protein